jgi:hypothetical protein
MRDGKTLISLGALCLQPLNRTAVEWEGSATNEPSHVFHTG